MRTRELNYAFHCHFQCGLMKIKKNVVFLFFINNSGVIEFSSGALDFIRNSPKKTQLNGKSKWRRICSVSLNKQH